PGDRYVEFALASAVYVYGGRPFLTGLVDELRQRLPGMMTLVALAITVAYAYSTLVVFGLPGSVFFWETATLIDIMLLGHWIEKGKGDPVIGGAVNGEGAITVAVKRTGAETYLSQVVELVRRAQETRSRTQDLADRAALRLTLVAIGGGTVTLVAWLAAGREFSFALERMVTVMVITCPHALGLAVPLVVAVSTSLSARSGLLIRDRSAFERAREVAAVVFDKTGTLTEGRFGVTDVVALEGRDERDVLRLGAALESRSEHPIAAGSVQAATER